MALKVKASKRLDSNKEDSASGLALELNVDPADEENASKSQVP